MRVVHDAQFVKQVRGGIELRIKVVPGASRSEIVGVLADRLKVRIAAPPQRGKANAALLELLAAWLGTTDLRLVAGHSGAQKTVHIAGLSALSEDHLKALR
jgi:uncharacterized protein